MHSLFQPDSEAAASLASIAPHLQYAFPSHAEGYWCLCDERTGAFVRRLNGPHGEFLEPGLLTLGLAESHVRYQRQSREEMRKHIIARRKATAKKALAYLNEWMYQAQDPFDWFARRNSALFPTANWDRATQRELERNDPNLRAAREHMEKREREAG